MSKTILLDVDGTLIDSNDAHARSWMEALEEAGFEPKYPSIRKKIGMGSDHLLPSVTGVSKDDPEGAAISKRRGEIFRQKYLPKLHAFRGTRELLERLRAAGYKLMIATSASKEDLEGLLKQAGLDDMELPSVSAGGGKSSKPEPDIIEAALHEAGASPEETVMLGDTPYDVAAAEKAGVSTIGFTCGGWMKDDLRPAVAVYEGPWDLLAHLNESPLNRPLQKAS